MDPAELKAARDDLTAPLPVVPTVDKSNLKVLLLLNDSELVQRHLVSIENGFASAPDPDATDQLCSWCVFSGRSGILQHVLNSEHFDLDTEKYTALLCSAVSKNSAGCVEALLEDGRAEPGHDTIVLALQDAAHYGHFEAIELIVAHAADQLLPGVFRSVMGRALRSGHSRIVEFLVRGDYAVPDHDNLITAIVNNDTVSFDAILDHGDGIDINLPVWNKVFYMGHYADRFDHRRKFKNSEGAAYEGKALNIAAEKGHEHMVERLLAHPDIRPGCNNSIALQKAAERGRVGVVRMLLEDARARERAIRDTLAEDSLTRDELTFCETAGIPIGDATIFAVHKKIEKECVGVDPAARHSAALSDAADFGCPETVRLLLEDADVRSKEGLGPGADAAKNNWLGLRQAFKRLNSGHRRFTTEGVTRADLFEVVRMLIARGPPVEIFLPKSAKTNLFHTAVVHRDVDAIGLVLDYVKSRKKYDALLCSFSKYNWRGVLRSSSTASRVGAREQMEALLEILDEHAAL